MAQGQIPAEIGAGGEVGGQLLVERVGSAIRHFGYLFLTEALMQPTRKCPSAPMARCSASSPGSLANSSYCRWMSRRSAGPRRSGQSAGPTVVPPRHRLASARRPWPGPRLGLGLPGSCFGSQAWSFSAKATLSAPGASVSAARARLPFSLLIDEHNPNR